MSGSSTSPGPGSGGPGRSAYAGGLLLGLGLGGFVDGILLHQVLQWHHVLSDVPGDSVTTVAGLRVNTLADGIFHTGTWVLVVAGVAAVVHAWRSGRAAPAWQFHVGLVLAGWGVFDVVEGVVDHQVLGIHHVRDDLGGPLSWDLGFLAFGVLLALGGAWLHRRGLPEGGAARAGGPRAGRAGPG